MKLKNVQKKLGIRKLTISDLNLSMTAELKGGISNTRCFSVDPNATCTVTIDYSLDRDKYTICMMCVP